MRLSSFIYLVVLLVGTVLAVNYLAELIPTQAEIFNIISK
jgi:hypothetical protein